MESASTTLLQYGAIGVVLAAVLGLFLWAFKRLFTHVLDQWKDFQKFMEATIKEMQTTREATIASNREILHRLELILRREAPTGPITLSQHDR